MQKVPLGKHMKYFAVISAFFSLRAETGTRLCCALLCALFVWGLSGCGAHRSASSTKTPPTAKKVMENAYSQIGVRYKSGGNSPGKGFDCSGFVQWAYKQQGIAVPRVTSDQARAGRLVAPKEGLQPADILVFKSRRGPRGLHTGLYAGGGQFIHSPSTGQRVRTESLEAAYWKNTLIGARRLIN
jgi:cell wall-associated NlpC family hydrolase